MSNIILALKDKLKKNPFFQNIAIVAGGNISAKLITIIATPIITRIYSPDEYGVYTIFLSIIGITGSLATLRYSVTIPLAKDEKSSENLLKLCFIVTFILSLFILLIISLSSNWLSEHYDSHNLINYLWLIPIVFFCQGIYEALNYWAIRNKGFKLITRTKISQSISSSIIKIGLGLMKIGPLGLFLGHIAQEATGIGSISSKLRKVRPDFFKDISLKEIKRVGIRYKNFPLVQSWSQLLLALGAQLPVLLLGFFYDARIVGTFGLALSMISLPMDLIGQSVAQVYYAEISKYGKDNPDKIYTLSISLIKNLFIIGLFPVVFLIAFGPWLFKVVFGPEWIDAGKYAQLLSIMILTRFISSPISNIFNVYEKQKSQLILNIIRVIIVLIVFGISYSYSFSPINSIGLYSLVITLYYAYLSFEVLNIVKNKLPN